MVHTSPRDVSPGTVGNRDYRSQTTKTIQQRSRGSIRADFQPAIRLARQPASRAAYRIAGTGSAALDFPAPLAWEVPRMFEGRLTADGINTIG